MKYVDRKALGMEMFLARRSSMLADITDLTADDVRERLSDANERIRFSLAQIIRLTLIELRNDDLLTADAIPEEISSLFPARWEAESASIESLTRFFTWLLGVQTANEQNRVSRAAGVNRAASHMDSDSGEFFRTFFSLSNQRVFISMKGDTVTVMSAEREWGGVRAVFTGCALPDDAPELPLPGYAFGTEMTELPDGRTQVSLLVDTVFRESDYPKRLLRDEGWTELSFTASSAGAEFCLYDYCGRMARLGTPRFEVIERGSDLMVSKKEIAGSGAMTQGERDMLPVAGFLLGSSMLLSRSEKDSRDYYENMVIDALDNRHAMRGFAELLRECGCAELAGLVEGGAGDCCDDNCDEGIKKAKMFYAFFEKCVANGSARTLVYRLSERFIDATSEIQDDPLRLDAERQMLELVRSATQLHLDSMGFEGSFPHYSRVRCGSIEYISLMLDVDSDKPKHGIVSYYASVAAAKISAERGEQLRLAGMPRERTNALDCLPESLGTAKYGELAGSADGIFVKIEADLYASPENRIISDESDRLPEFIGIAEQQFVKGRIPSGYRRLRRRSGRPSGVFALAFADSLPVSVIAVIAAMLGYIFFLRGNVQLPLSEPAVALCALGGGLVLNVLLTAVRCRVKSFSLWNY